jgi:hypothetical protein
LSLHSGAAAHKATSNMTSEFQQTQNQKTQKFRSEKNGQKGLFKNLKTAA